jgi:hypothetical protein
MVSRLAAVLTAGIALVLASSAAAQAPSGDAVTGGASLFLPVSCFPVEPCDPSVPPVRLVSIEVDAHSGPSGENPTGTVRWFQDFPQVPISFRSNIEVTCLEVEGNVAVIGGVGRQAGGAL